MLYELFLKQLDYSYRQLILNDEAIYVIQSLGIAAIHEDRWVETVGSAEVQAVAVDGIVLGDTVDARFTALVGLIACKRTPVSGELVAQIAGERVSRRLLQALTSLIFVVVAVPCDLRRHIQRDVITDTVYPAQTQGAPIAVLAGVQRYIGIGIITSGGHHQSDIHRQISA